MSANTLWCQVIDYHPEHFDTIVELMRTSMDARWNTELVSRILNTPGISCKVAVKRRKTYGFVIYEVEQKIVDIKFLVVCDRNRRRHIGRQLLSRVLLSLRDGKAITLRCMADNAVGMDFWRANGFRAKRILRGYYGGRHDALAMAWVLPGCEY